MKYIRTEDRIYEVLRESETKKSYITKKSGLVIHKDMVIKEAETIEELCDEFVFNVENQGHWVINNYKRALEIAKSYNEDKNKFICYGAIWTNKSLQFVARMNSKGELVLL